MKKRLWLILFLFLLALLLLLPRRSRAQLYPACQADGWPGGYYPYCVTSDLVVRSWVIPSDPPEALYELCGTEAAYNRLHVLQPLWRDLTTYGQAYDTLEMPEAGRWVVIPTREHPCAVLRVPIEWPGAPWVPDLEEVQPTRVWVPLVEG